MVRSHQDGRRTPETKPLRPQTVHFVKPLIHSWIIPVRQLEHSKMQTLRTALERLTSRRVTRQEQAKSNSRYIIRTPFGAATQQPRL